MTITFPTHDGDSTKYLDAVDEYRAGLPVRPCPTWCERPTGHPWTGGNNFNLADVERTHRLTIATGVTIEAGEAMEPDGTIWWRWFGPAVDGEINPCDHTADDLVEYAHQLLRAAEVLRSLPPIDCSGEAERQARWDAEYDARQEAER